MAVSCKFMRTPMRRDHRAPPTSLTSSPVFDRPRFSLAVPLGADPTHRATMPATITRGGISNLRATVRAASRMPHVPNAQLVANSIQSSLNVAVLATKASRDDAKRALTDQLASIERLFKPGEERSSARALIVGTTKAINKLLSTVEELEAQSTAMQGELLTQAHDLRLAIEGGHRNLREMKAYYEAALQSLSTELKEAEGALLLEYPDVHGWGPCMP